jgi:hypothetical protein
MFFFTQEATQGFEKIKMKISSTLILATLDFTKKLIVECDASRHGIGVVLMQEENPLGYESCQIK